MICVPSGESCGFDTLSNSRYMSSVSLSAAVWAVAAIGNTADKINTKIHVRLIMVVGSFLSGLGLLRMNTAECVVKSNLCEVHPN